ncbi:MAG: O-antigen ligase family protein [Cytophagales bacterium]|nr:O-antigen ligase family protein [Cytophagales bacterium]
MIWAVYRGFTTGFRFHVVLLVFIAFYILLVFSLLYTIDLRQGWKVLFAKLPILIWPLAINQFSFSEKSLIRVVQIFVGSLTLFCLYGLVVGVYVHFFTGHGDTLPAYQSAYLAGYMNFHAPYLAAYIVFALFLLVHFGKNLFHIGLLAAAMFMLMATLILLSTRQAFIALAICSLVYSVWWAIERKKYWIPLVTVFAFVLLFILAYQFVDYFRYKIELVSNWSRIQGDPRYGIFINTWSVIRENIFWGHGVGDARELLTKSYERYGDQSLISWNFNAHNDLLTLWMYAGLPCALAYICALVYPFVASLKARAPIYAVFATLIFMAGLTENFLDRHKGVMFYAFFNALLFSIFLVNRPKHTQHESSAGA